MSDKNSIHILGYALGLGGRVTGAENSPEVLKNSNFMKQIKEVDLVWEKIFTPDEKILDNKLQSVKKTSEEMAKEVSKLVSQKKSWLVVGGDHTCAIGTWSGAYDAVHQQGDLGLIWIDAHMDSHTPQTSITGNLHGMPLACLLGHGDPDLLNILSNKPKIKPENLCLIGIRSYESHEAALLEKLNVRIFYMDEVKAKGIETIMRQAIEHVSKHTNKYGVSLDIDAIDPEDAPGTGVSEPDGIKANNLLEALKMLRNDPKLIGFEIVEFNSKLDIDKKTEKLIPEIISTIYRNNG